MRICCLTRVTLAHASKGGLEVHVKTLSEGLVQRGHAVTIITTMHPEGHNCEEHNGVHIHYCPSTAPGQYSEVWGEASIELLSALHRKAPFDLIWGEHDGAHYYLRSARRRLQIPVVTILQQSFLGELRSQYAEVRYHKKLIVLFVRQLPGRVARYIKRDLVYAGRADAVIAPSGESARDARMEYFLGKNRLYASVNGVDTDRFRPLQAAGEAIRARYGIADDTQLVFTASRLVRGKGIHLLLRVLPTILRVVPGVKLLIAGIGPGRAQLEALAAELRISEQVIFLGYVPHEQLPAYYNACDLFVYPTLLYESFGISVAEAMACGRPVVAARSGGIRTSIDHGVNGLLYTPQHAQELATHSIAVLRNPQYGSRLGEAARVKAVRVLSSTRMVDDAIAVFSRVIGSPR